MTGCRYIALRLYWRSKLTGRRETVGMMQHEISRKLTFLYIGQVEMTETIAWVMLIPDT